MQPVVCSTCGHAYDAASKTSRCPRCARIDALLPTPEEPPPPVVIPGPPSDLSNTLTQTRASVPPDLTQFAASASAPAPARPSSDLTNTLAETRARFAGAPVPAPVPIVADEIE